MDTRVLTKLAVNEEDVQWGRRIINKSDINEISRIKASAMHEMRIDNLCVTAHVTDINQVLTLNEMLNPFMIEQGKEYKIPDDNMSKYYDAFEITYPKTDKDEGTASDGNEKLTAEELTQILKPIKDKNRL